jgi:hypothetical protein
MEISLPHHRDVAPGQVSQHPENVSPRQVRSLNDKQRQPFIFAFMGLLAVKIPKSIGRIV